VAGSAARGDHVARAHLDALDPDLLGAVEAERVQHLEDVDELVAEAVLERRALAVDPARHEEDLLVLHVHALDRADPSGKSKTSGSENGGVVRHSPVLARSPAG
jgi:hypothetical protein